MRKRRGDYRYQNVRKSTPPSHLQHRLHLVQNSLGRRQLLAVGGVRAVLVLYQIGTSEREEVGCVRREYCVLGCEGAGMVGTGMDGSFLCGLAAWAPDTDWQKVFFVFLQHKREKVWDIRGGKPSTHHRGEQVVERVLHARLAVADHHRRLAQHLVLRKKI